MAAANGGVATNAGAPPVGAGPSGGAPGTGVTDASRVSFDEFSYRLAVTCGNIICHLPNYNPPDYSNRDGTLYDTLLTWRVAQCDDAPIVVPGDPDASAMIRLVKRQCGSLFMPTTCEPDRNPCIYPDELEVFESWIRGGALPD